MIAALIIVSGFVFSVSITGCGKTAPLKIDDLSTVIPGDNPDEYDVYRVVAVKKDVSKQELVGLMEYFTKQYLDTNRVMIYVFSSSAAAHLGQSEYIVATYFQDKHLRKYEREILLDRPK
jgi:hypothetical protein